ncbi:outer-membrane lipoproteins carrier protein [Oleiphilus messinensis]|uniref:Outer-membrane lipoprotein carrier protein n=1 Tax=Oleiphilus messinensis TaxID=141451 RepID=A0A1Y0IC10_9GAMM|nr:outer membrane lipoprotein chaperone LolA [Oleiphilus messinensis]ARU57306.1 outer-membrane lipoproteins carrier protein [Oleiphilus messinensis]
MGTVINSFVAALLSFLSALAIANTDADVAAPDDVNLPQSEQLSATGSAQNINSDTTDNQLATEKLAANLKGLETFKSRFVQFMVDKSGAVIQETQGRFLARRPGQFLWHTDPPLEQVIFSDGSLVTVYDPDLEQVTIQKMNPEAASTPALLLSGDVENLSASYRVEYHFKQGVEIFSLIPKSNDSLFESLSLKFIEGQIIEMRLRDSLGQKTTLSFTEVQANIELSDEALQYPIPDGVDVIRE